ncbi:cobaltochelatase subunit CobN [Sphingomonas morindae]|uniref:Cobaltochelatase subunit CobN n=1 Tax=Sphingomonas morindae TaxID=1541170 RepID=A0ABY4X6L3_9SPHN|nr:cobaltochelatase subunit CobN [Sphingomonas morindae]USI72543.1 cobaltochelatase subunit CobN [Sphingomonas morindae]
MHLVFRESHGLETGAAPRALGHGPADLAILSFSDSELAGFAAGWRALAEAAGEAPLPRLSLAPLALLGHPLSVDTYVEETLGTARAILVRLIGGRAYWRYGLDEIVRLARARGIALAVLAGDGRTDAALEACSTLSPAQVARLRRCCETGGAASARAALALLAEAGGLALPAFAPATHADRPIPPVGGWRPDGAADCPAAFALTAPRPRALLLFYRAYLVAEDVAPVAALHAALAARGFAVLALFLPSLKAEAASAWLARWAEALAPDVILNLTAFSARGDDGATPLDGSDAPVLQIALATSDRAAWAAAPRGLSPADLAMHVVLPELDGRLFAGVASFKQAAAGAAGPEQAPPRHAPEPERVAAIADRAAAWARLRGVTPAARRVALILSTYPGRPDQIAHAVGLDALGSAAALLADWRAEGMAVPASDAADIAARLAAARIAWPLHAYRAALATLPAALVEAVAAAWGPPEADAAVAGGAFHFAAIEAGAALIALQPERATPEGRSDSYHDLGRCPRHAYIAFYLWLRTRAPDALIHLGAHGTLEWLPGKAVALSGACWPDALAGALPILYPFIVNDPGEAAQAKRRLGAVTIGHAPPPLATSGGGVGTGRLETLLDEYGGADGLDPPRRARLATAIVEEAEALGLGALLRLGASSTPDAALARIDAFVCDMKDSQFPDGLHLFGRGPQGEAERAGLAAGLSGRRVAPGPAGSPHRGRADVLPTGRNLYSLDPRALPSRDAHDQGVALADELLRRHLQDEGDYPRAVLVDLWGSATMRTAGEDFAMALHLLGVAPIWDHGSARVTGIEILPLAMLDRPRIDVTLRVSGLFRDAFPGLCALFGQATRLLAARDEPTDQNPFAGATVEPRVFGPAPGRYGVDLGALATRYDADAREAAGKAWLAASATALDAGDRADPAGLARRVAATQAFLHVHDLPESDSLAGMDHAAHQAGFAAAQRLLGRAAPLYHLDSRDPARPRARSLAEELARIVRTRAAHPGWIAGMMRHGFRGAAELAAVLDHLGAYAHLAACVPPELFDLYYAATLGTPAVRAFMASANPEALAALEARFAALHAAGLWRSRSNALVAALADPA